MARFVTFEGGDGSGKSTQVRLLERYLVQRGQACLVTREPGGTSLGKLIRQAVLEVSEHEIAPAAELFLYLADRAQHVSEVIRPALTSGKIVLCDRFTDSTLAYQGYGRGIDLKLLGQFNDLADGGLRPELTFLLDCPVTVGLARTSCRPSGGTTSGQDRFEREAVEFHERVRIGFHAMARAEPKRFRIIDSTRPPAEVAGEIQLIAEREIL